MNENTALTTTDEQALALLNGMDLTPGGMENVKREDVAQPPRLVISSQNRPLQTADGTEVTPGHIVNLMTGQDYGTTVAGVFLRFMSDTRVMWPSQYSADNDPECASDDAVWPSQSSAQRPLTNPQKGPCESCPMAQFGPNGEAPRCQRQRNFLVWLIDSEEPVLLTAKSTGLKFAKTLTNLAVSCNVRRSIWFTTQKLSDERGTWYVMAYTQGDKLPPKLSLDLYELKNSMADIVITADTEREAQANGADPAPPVDDEVPF